MKTLRKGDTGSEVYDLQGTLNILGAKLDVDGDFGELTEKAVTRFQIEYGLTPDGIVGTKTQKILDLAILMEAYKLSIEAMHGLPAVQRLEEVIYG